MRVNGNKVNETAKASTCGLTLATTKETGKKTKLKEQVNQSIKMVIFMKENGKMIWLMAQELIFIQVELNIMGSGSTISSMAKGRKSGQMGPSIKGNMHKEKRMEKEHFILPMAQNTQANLKIMIFKEQESIYGRMEKFIKVNGKTTK